MHSVHGFSRWFSSKGKIIKLPEQPLTEYLFEHATKYPTKPALVEAASGRTVTYGSLLARIASAAKGFAQMGIQKGDVVGLHLPNLPEYIVAFQAIATLGAINTTSNPLYTAAELAHQLRDANAKCVLTVPAFADTVRSAASQANTKHVIVLGEGSGSFLLAEDSESTPRTIPIDVKQQLVALPYSSGTTGLPKGVMLTHHNITSNVAQILDEPSHTVGLRHDDIVLGLLPMYHIYGMTFNTCATIRSGCTVVTLPKFDPALFLESIQRYKITYAPLVPPIVNFLARHPMISKHNLSSIRLIFSGAAHLDADTQQAIEARLGLECRQGYGMTELSPVSHIPNQHISIPGSIGLTVPNSESKIVDTETGEELPPGKDHVGELCFRGPNVMKGYLNNEEATRRTIVDGWLHTGDLAYRDAQHVYYIVDRVKELIKCKGLQVAPAELEGILLGHPDVVDVAVVGQPDTRAGEVPVAYIVAKSSEATPVAGGLPKILSHNAELETRIKQWLAPRIAEYKQLSRIAFVDSIPKSASGKILRRVLRDMAKDIRA